MSDTSKSLAMRIENGAGRESAIVAALAPQDAGAAVLIDTETGIAHVTTALEAIEVDDLLTKAGFTVTAPTG